MKVWNQAKIRNRYDQVPRLTKDITWEGDKNIRKHHIQESEEVSPFSAGNHKSAMNRKDSMTDKKHKLVSWYQPHHYF